MSDPTPEHPENAEQGRELGGYSERFAEDTGAADAQVRHALGVAESSGESTDYLTAVVALCGSRLLVPLLADGDDTMSPDPQRHGELAAVLLRHPDRGTAMLAFTGTDALREWNARARPVPATLDVVAQTAEQSGAGTVLIDFAGPHPLVIDGEVLANLARSRRLVRLDGGFGWLATRS